MINPIQRPHLRSRLARFVLLGIMALTALGLSQCRLMEDPITGVDVRDEAAFSKKRSKCVHRCERDYKRCSKKESERHHDAKRECEKLKKKGDEKKKCLKAESARHDAEKEACKDAKRKCKASCRYNEGAGSGGR